MNIVFNKKQLTMFCDVRLSLRAMTLIAVSVLASCSDGTSPPLAPAKLAFTVQPPASVTAGESIAPVITVEIQDENGNKVATATDMVTIAIATNPANGKLSGVTTRGAFDGVATFPDLSIDKTGSGYTFSVAAANLTGSVSTPLNVKPGSATSLVFLTQPVTGNAVGALPEFTVAIQDAAGNTVETAENRVSVALYANTAGASVLGGSVSVPASGGIARFADVRIQKAGSGYQLVASSTSLIGRMSQTFNILPGPANRLVFTTQPANAVAGGPISPFSVEVQDAVGNRVPNASNTVSIVLGANPSAAELSGGVSVQPVDGKATFNDVRIDKAGAGLAIVAQSPGLASATSQNFSVRNPILVSMSAAGYFHSCVIDTTGGAYCWGDNGAGQLGNSLVATRPSPEPVQGGISFASITAGRDHSCGLTAQGVAYCWGANDAGQLGSNVSAFGTPRPPTGNLVFKEISAGYVHTCGVTATGKGYCWGGGNLGAIGQGSFANAAEPTPVSGGLEFAGIVAGRLFTCGVTTGGLGYCWGDNSFGQLGNGTKSQTAEPSPVSGSLRFTAVSAGGFHSCGLTTAGAAYCWGENISGQLGNGNFDNTAVPVAVSGGRIFKSIAVGNRHNCGLTIEGDAYCWGDNTSSHLGIGTSQTNSAIPVLVVGGHKFASITAGRFHTCAVTAQQEAYCWGTLGGGLGDGRSIVSSTPVRVR
jgi:alpha-tubulin suppressor-like RCC1 family protein